MSTPKPPATCPFAGHSLAVFPANTTSQADTTTVAHTPLAVAGSAPTPPVEQGSLLQFSDDPIACMRRLHRKHGDLAVLQEGGQKLVFVFSPELNRQVLADGDTFQSQFFAVRGSRNSAQRRVTSGLLSQNGTEHRDTRRLLKDVFAKKALPGYHGIICRLTDELTTRWNRESHVDLNGEMVQFMLRMTSALLFGLDDPEFAEKLGRLIDRWTHRNHEVGMGALVSAPQFARGYELLLQQAEELESSIREMFARHRSGNSDGLNILHLLMQATESGGSMTDDQLTGHATLLFAAAHLTTAHTFSWTLFLLAQHPDVLARLTHELQTHVAGDVPTLDELEQLKYLDAVIRESMRILPASSYSQRVTAGATSLGPLQLNPGTPVIFSQFITHHRADLYEQPDRFIPERWEHIAPSPYAYLPFGAGPRMCIGAPLAVVEIRTALTIMLKRFHFQIEPSCTVDGRVISTMLGPTTPIPASLLPASQLPRTVPVNGSIHSLVELPPAALPATQRRAA
jgi:cytochrome P450